MEVGVPGRDLSNAVLAHQHDGVRIVEEVSSQYAFVLGQDLPRHVDVAASSDQDCAGWRRE